MSRATLLVLALLAAGPALAGGIPPEGLRAEGEGRWTQALEIYDRALQRDLDNVELWLRVAEINAVALKQPAAAARALEHAAEARPADADLWLKASQNWSMANEPQRALAAAQRAVKADLKDVRYRRAVAELAQWAGDLKLAEATWRWLIRANPRDAALLKPLAQVLSRQGRLDESVEYYAAYVGAQPDDAPALLEYASAQMYRGDFAAADALLKDYAGRFGRTDALQVAEADLLMRAGKPRSAMERLPTLLASNPDSYELRLIQTLALNSGRRPGDAQVAVDDLHRLGPARTETRGAGWQVNTPWRTHLVGSTEWYDDTGGIVAFTSGTRFGISPWSQAMLTVGADHWRVESEAGNGFDTPVGTSEEADGLRVTLAQQVMPWVGFRVASGTFHTDLGSTPYLLAAVDWYPADALTVRLSSESELLRVSPRSMYLGIERETSALTAQWQQGFRSTLDLRLAHEDYNDGNTAGETMVTQRFAVERNARYNFDLGLRGQLLHYAYAPAHGYYAPDDFRRLWAVGYGWWKLSDQSGIGLSLGAGPERDYALDTGYEWGGDARVEGLFGVFRDWQLRTYAGYGGRFDGGATTGAYRGSGLGLEITRRF